MRRRVEVGTIQASHAATEHAERQRELARPPAYAPRVTAAPEPEPEPRPTPGRGERIGRVRVVQVRHPDGSVVLDPDEARAVRAALREVERETRGVARVALSQARQTLDARTTGGL